VRALYSVDFPTFGRPTRPTFKFEEKRPRDHGPGLSSTTSFFGGIDLPVACVTCIRHPARKNAPTTFPESIVLCHPVVRCHARVFASPQTRARVRALAQSRTEIRTHAHAPQRTMRG
jgi:hypothetical protein